jgi:hypothetical protein
MSQDARARDAFTARMLAALPSVRGRYETVAAECEAEGIGDGATDIFLDEYGRELVDRYATDPAGAGPELTAFTGFLEAEYGADRHVDSMITSTLVHFAGGGAEPDPAAVLGPKLRAVVDESRNWRSRPEDAELVARLLAAVPDLARDAAENTFGDHEDVLSHPFLSDVARRETANVAAGARSDEVRTVLDVLEAAVEAGGPAAGNDGPILVSFLEALPYPDEPGAAIVGLLGPRLRGELERQRR